MSENHLPTARILIVDDEQTNVDLLVGCIEDEGYHDFVSTRDPEAVAALVEWYRPDLVLLDLQMPRLDGFAVMEQLGRQVAGDDFLPVLVLTADATQETKERALSRGATDFLTKPLDLAEVMLRIRNLLHTRRLHVNQRRARQLAEEAERRASLLADASRGLASSFDNQTTLSLLCRALVPRLADYCVIDVVQADGSVQRPGIAHFDPGKEHLLREIAHARSLLSPSENPIAAALGMGRRTLLPEITPETISGTAGDPESSRLIEQLDPRSSISVPISTSGRIHGALSLVHSESGRRFGTEDLDLASELASRAAMTIENARLFDQAQGATRDRDEMLAIVAHDLRNPLSTITMGAAMLSESLLDDQSRRYVDLVGRAAGRMQALIQDLLQARQIESGQLRVSLRAEPVAPLVKEAVAMLRPLAEARKIELTAVLDDGLRPAMLDSTRILQVLSNLVGNALKFTPEGGRVEIGCEPLESELRFVVSDTGPGIPPEDIPHIFGRFWQAADRDTRGIGLGLSIVRGIVDAHGGRVWVECAPGQGARFYFTVPSPPITAFPLGPLSFPLPASVREA